MSTKTAILSICVLAGCGGRGGSGSVPDATYAVGGTQLVQSLAVSGDIVYAGGAFTRLGDIALGFFGAVDASTGEIRR